MLGHLYYILGILPLIAMLSVLARIGFYHRISQWTLKFKEITGKDPTRKDYRTPDEYGFIAGVTAITVFEFIWILIGILSSNWYVFLLLILLVVLINVLKKNINISIVSLFLSVSILLSKILVYLYLIVNHFHLHYDTWNMIKSYIQ